MSARRIVVAVAIACGALAPVSAGAENLLTLGVGPFIPDRGKTEQGIGVGLAVPTQSWILFQVRADASRSNGHDYGAITFGPQIGTTRGKLRPYLSAGVGLSAGDLAFTGVVAVWGAGAVYDLAGRLGVFADARSFTSGNAEGDAHFKQIRAGISLRSGQRKK